MTENFVPIAAFDASDHRVDHAQVSTAHCRLFLRELAARGVDCERQLSLLGIPSSQDHDGERFVSAGRFSAFLQMASQITNDPYIGLHAGERIREQDLDLLGLLIRCSPDLRSACDQLNKYQGAIQHVLDTEIATVDGQIRCRCKMSGVAPSRIVSDYILARSITLMNLLLGPLAPLAVRTIQPPPADLSEHQRVLGATLCFSANEDAIVLPADTMSRAMLHADAGSAQVLSRYVARLPGVESPGPLALTERVRSAIEDELREGRATFYAVATRLNRSERTLRRQLAERGVRFQILLDEIRRDRALNHLKQSGFSTTVLSARLGFMGTGAFYRAFRRWMGVSLAEYRATQGRAEQPAGPADPYSSLLVGE